MKPEFPFLRISENLMAPVIHLTGSLDALTAPLLDAAIREQLVRGQIIVIDLSGVEWISSPGLRTLLAIRKIVNARRGTLLLTGNASKRVRLSLDLVGLETNYQFIDADILSNEKIGEMVRKLEKLRIEIGERGIFSELLEKGETSRRTSLDEAEEAPPPPILPPEGEPAGEVDSGPTEAVHFTAFHPREAAVEKRYTLLVYAHLAQAIKTIRKDAKKFEDEMGALPPREVGAEEPVRLPKGMAVTVVPSCQGVRFNPEQITFRWENEYHRTAFEMTGERELAGKAGNGVVAIFAGLLIARIPFSVFFDLQEPAGITHQEDTADIFDVEDVFISYAHRDAKIVYKLKTMLKAFGHRTWIDHENLQTGEVWSAKIEQAIKTTDVFQLFWSKHAADSEYVRLEYEFALECQKPVYPVYWTSKLMPKPPSKLSQIQFGQIPPELFKS